MAPLQLKNIPEEAIVNILEFLRATDLAAVSEVDKTVFHRTRIQRAIRYQIHTLYPSSYAGTPLKEKRSLSFTDCTSPKGTVRLSFDSPTASQSPSCGSDVNGSGGLGSCTLENFGCDYLYVREIKCILAAVQAPQPLTGKGYWISTSWIANAKKYFEALSLPDTNMSMSKKNSPHSNSKKGHRQESKHSKIRQRRGSDALPPWPSMTVDITCTHGNLALTKGARSKKRLIDGRAWFFLRKFYPNGPQFKSTRVVECSTCTCDDEEAKATVNGKREADLRTRRSGYVSGPLEAVAVRKSGVPSHLARAGPISAAQRNNARLLASPIHISEEQWLAMISPSSPSVAPDPMVSSSPQSVATDPDALLGGEFMKQRCDKKAEPTGQPLLPGLYNLVPKAWLKSWRQFTKDPTVTALPPLDCTCMLCHTHGHLVIPPHFEEYILGMKKSLVSGLGTYEGQIFEILSADEWDALQESLKSLSDFSVRFCLDGDNLSWNSDVCTYCDPFNYGSRVEMGEGHF